MTEAEKKRTKINHDEKTDRNNRENGTKTPAVVAVGKETNVSQWGKKEERKAK